MDYQFATLGEEGEDIGRKRVTKINIKWDNEADLVEIDDLHKFLNTNEVTYCTFRADLYHNYRTDDDSEDSDEETLNRGNVFKKLAEGCMEEEGLNNRKSKKSTFDMVRKTLMENLKRFTAYTSKD